MLVLYVTCCLELGNMLGDRSFSPASAENAGRLPYDLIERSDCLFLTWSDVVLVECCYMCMCLYACVFLHKLIDKLFHEAARGKYID